MDVQASGSPAHTRALVVSIHQESARRWEARATLLDLRKRGLVPMAADLQTAGVIHDMRVRAGVERGDPARFGPIAVEQPSVAFEPSPGTGGECCRDPAERLGALVGTPVDGEATRRLGRAIGGPLGCSHVLTLTQLLIAALQRALAADRALHGETPHRPEGQRVFHRSLTVDGLQGSHAIHLTAQLADVHFAPTEVRPETDPFDRLAGRTEVRAAAEVEPGSMQLRALRAAERSGVPERFPGDWLDRSGELAGLAGRSALGGMASALFDALGDRDADRPLLDTLLNLAPTLIQCIPALLDLWEPSGRSGRPAQALSGGMPDSCYMWRRGGALVPPEISARTGRAHRAATLPPRPSGRGGRCR